MTSPDPSTSSSVSSSVSSSSVVGAILCAGLGTRMHPLTQALPKPLIPFLNTPMITYALNHLARAGVTRVGLNLHHLPDAIPPVVDRLCGLFGLRPVYTREWELLGSGGGLRGLLHALSPEQDCTLVALNADSVMTMELADHVAEHLASGAQATLLVRPREPGQPGRVWLDDQGQIMRLRDHLHPRFDPRATYHEHDFTGVQILHSALLRPLPIEPFDVISALYGPMVEAGQGPAAQVMHGFWAALDSPALLLQAQRRCLEDPACFGQAPLPEPAAQGMYLYSPSQIAPDAQLQGPLLLGAHVQVGSRAQLGPHVVADGVELAPGAQLSDCMLYGMGRVEGCWERVVAVAGQIASVS